MSSKKIIALGIILILFSTNTFNASPSISSVPKTGEKPQVTENTNKKTENVQTGIKQTPEADFEPQYLVCNNKGIKVYLKERLFKKDSSLTDWKMYEFAFFNNNEQPINIKGAIFNKISQAELNLKLAQIEENNKANQKNYRYDSATGQYLKRNVPRAIGGVARTFGVNFLLDSLINKGDWGFGAIVGGIVAGVDAVWYAGDLAVGSTKTAYYDSEARKELAVERRKETEKTQESRTALEQVKEVNNELMDLKLAGKGRGQMIFLIDQNSVPDFAFYFKELDLVFTQYKHEGEVIKYDSNQVEQTMKEILNDPNSGKKVYGSLGFIDSFTEGFGQIEELELGLYSYDGKQEEDKRKADTIYFEKTLKDLSKDPTKFSEFATHTIMFSGCKTLNFTKKLKEQIVYVSNDNTQDIVLPGRSASTKLNADKLSFLLINNIFHSPNPDSLKLYKLAVNEQGRVLAKNNTQEIQLVHYGNPVGFKDTNSKYTTCKGAVGEILNPIIEKPQPLFTKTLLPGEYAFARKENENLVVYDFSVE
jgi:hypothetical protein